jgi:rhamnose transport system ATP-binding protein
VKIAGATLPPGDPIAAIRAGLALVPEDRKGQGLFASMSILENMAMPAFPAGPLGLLRRGRDRRAAEDGIARLGIAAHSVDQGAATLSGGNQQKMMLARWLALAPKVLIVDEPTRGIDVGAKREIYDLLRGLAASGPGIVVVSSEIPELIELAGRVLVMREGRIVGELRGGDINEDAIGRLQVGL